MFCQKCGTNLIIKKDNENKDIPYCDKCKEFRYPTYNIAVSMIVKYNNKIILIKQYKRDRYILVAGYLSNYESAEEALSRELNEELGLKVINYRFNETKYYEKTNTYMINFVVDGTGFISPNEEIDSYDLFNVEDALANIAKNSLAEYFLNQAIKRKIL